MLKNDADRALKGLRVLIHGGNYFTVGEAEQLRRMAPDLRLFNVGGPSETTIWSIAHPITDEDIANGEIPYGKPLPGSTYYVLNECHELCPVGVERELYIGKSHVTDAYS